MEIEKIALDESWLLAAMNCYWRSSAKGNPYIPCPEALRPPSSSIFDHARDWIIYLPSLAGGYIVDSFVIDERADYEGWAAVIRFLGSFACLYLVIAMIESHIPIEWALGLTMIPGFFLIGIAPEFVYLPWNRRIRKQYQFVILPQDLRMLFLETGRKAQQGSKWAMRRGRFAAKIVGMVAEQFGGEIVGNLLELAVEIAVEEASETHLSQRTSEIIQEETSRILHCPSKSEQDRG